jgi:flagellar hook-basal body complex protein FliE
MSAFLATSIAAIQEPSLAPVPMPLSSNVAAPAAGSSFGHMVTDGLRNVSEQLQRSQADLQSLARGDADNLHQLMIRLEESRISFQLMLQVRNRLLESYQEVMRMQL